MRVGAAVGIALAVSAAAFLGWRLLRPMNIFTVADAFARPIDTSAAPASLGSLRAGECGLCHRAIYDEWKTSIHSQAWSDPYFQADWQFDGRQQICKNCHIPLDRQQEERVLGFRDGAREDPILAPNAAFDARLQHEGVTCAACHLREAALVGVHAAGAAPHPVRRIANANELCLRCHVVDGERWDTFWRYPPCGTVAEIRAGRGENVARSGETRLPDAASLGCVECHMPLVLRPIAEGGVPRAVRRHLWRGGHDPEMVRQALDIRLDEIAHPGERRFRLTLLNRGAAHFVPTGTPDRHLVLSLRLLDADGKAVAEDLRLLKRNVLWRPFIVDLHDTRLPPGQPRSHEFAFDAADLRRAQVLEAAVYYGLVEESRRRRIGYENREPVRYEVYRSRLPLRQAPGASAANP